MSDFLPLYSVETAIYFRYVPYDLLNTGTGEVTIQTPEIPAIVLSVAHNFDHDIETGLNCWMPRVIRIDWIGFFYFVEIDQEEAAALGLALTYPKGSLLTTEVIRENQIIGERIAF